MQHQCKIKISPVFHYNCSFEIITDLCRSGHVFSSVIFTKSGFWNCHPSTCVFFNPPCFETLPNHANTGWLWYCQSILYFSFLLIIFRWDLLLELFHNVSKAYNIRTQTLSNLVLLPSLIVDLAGLWVNPKSSIKVSLTPIPVEISFKV
jgi:hypothetical protein